MEAKARYKRRCLVTSSGITPVDVFTLNFSSWDEQSTDPSGGSNICAVGIGKISVNNTTDNTLQHYLFEFFFTRLSGGAGADFGMNILAPPSATGLSATSTGTAPNHVHKIQFTGATGKNQVVCGIVDFDVHY